MMSICSRIILVASIAVSLGGCTKDRANRDTAKTRNVVLITIDACRADGLSCYGNPHPTTPRIDALARQGVLFENAITPATSTLPSHCSILTGTTPPFHGVHADENYRLPQLNVTLAETLKADGFVTAAFVGSASLDSLFGLGQGFDTYDDDFEATDGGRRSAESVTNAALTWLQAHAAQRMFLVINYQDPTAPYVPPETYLTQQGGNAYLGELAYTDAQIGRVVDKLDSLSLSDSTLLIVAGAHGEGTGKHSESWHGFFVYHDTTHVPLVVKAPGRATGTRIQEKVGLIDIVPTVLSMMRLSDAPPVYGRDLSPYLAGKKTPYPGRTFYSESLLPTDYGCNALFAIEDQSWKYIQSKKPELYDLTGDPGETHNLFADQPNRSRAWQKRLKEELAATMRTSEKGKVFSGGADALAFETGMEDPKDFIRFYEMLAIARTLFARGDWDGVVSTCNSILKIRPDVSRAYELLGAVTPDEERDKKKDYFLDALKYNPRSVRAHFSLGNLYAQNRKLPEAETQFQKARWLADGNAVPDDSVIKRLTSFGFVPPLRFKARLHLADTLHIERKFEDATEAYYAALYLDPLIKDTPFFRKAKALAFIRLGHNLYFLERFDESVNAFQDALVLDPGSKEAQQGLDLSLTAQEVLKKEN